MGKLLKICLVIGLVCIGAGIAASAAGISLGGLTRLKEQLINGEWSFGKDMEPFFTLEDQEFFEEGFSVNDSSEKQEYAFPTEDIYGIYVKSSGITVKFMTHNGSDILIYVTKTGKYQNYVKDKELSIIAIGQSQKELGEGVVEILIPETLCQSGVLDMELEASACAIDLGRLSLDEVELEVSAGSVTWSGLGVTDLSMEMAAGAVHGSDTHILHKTEIDMHAGSVELSGSLGNETELEIMAGQIKMSLHNAFTDFNYDISCAGGSVTVGEETLQGLGKELKQNNQASNQIEIQCSMGAVEIQFDPEQEAE